MADAQLARIEETLRLLVTDVGGLRADVTRLDVKVDAIGARQAAFETSMKDSFSQLEAHLSDLYAYVVFADNRVREEAQVGLRRRDERFDRVDERLDQMDQRFDRMDQRFDRMDQRFDKMDQRFDRLESKLDAFVDTQGGVNLDVEIRLKAVERPH